MKFLGFKNSHPRLAAVVVLFSLAFFPVAGRAAEAPKVTMEDVLREIVKMRQELRELKIQRDRDQVVIEELRRIVEHGIPDLPVEGPQPATASARAAAAGAAAKH
jgi:hypothetical protein